MWGIGTLLCAGVEPGAEGEATLDQAQSLLLRQMTCLESGAGLAQPGQGLALPEVPGARVRFSTWIEKSTVGYKLLLPQHFQALPNAQRQRESTFIEQENMKSSTEFLPMRSELLQCWAQEGVRLTRLLKLCPRWSGVHNRHHVQQGWAMNVLPPV